MGSEEGELSLVVVVVGLVAYPPLSLVYHQIHHVGRLRLRKIKIKTKKKIAGCRQKGPANPHHHQTLWQRQQWALGVG